DLTGTESGMTVMSRTPEAARIARRGLMLILSSPSGAGKSTIARLLLEQETGLELSVSVTTRSRRASEIDGVHYHFLSKGEFDRLRSTDSLLEWAEVHGNYYGTPRDPVEAAMAEGRDMLFDIDWQGADQLKEKMRVDVVSIFILPPSMQELRARLIRRAEDSGQTIETRLENARLEIGQWQKYDYVVINDDLDRAFASVRAVVQAERLRRDRRPGLFEFVDGMLKG